MKHTETLKKSGFKYVYANAKSCADKALVMLCTNNGTKQNRLGIVASKKIGGAVVRNRARRRLREIYRKNEDMLRAGYDIVLIARGAINTTAHKELQEAFFRSAKRHRIWLESEKKK